MTVENRSSFRGAVLLATIGLWLVAGTAVRAEGAYKKFDFALPVRPLLDSLAAYSRLTGISVGVPGVDLKGRSSAPLAARLDPWEALGRLLKGSGLTYSRLGRDLAVLRPARRRDGPLDRPGGSAAPNLPPPPRVQLLPIEEIIVTASKRDLPVMRLPVSVSVVDSQRLRRFGIERGRDLLAHLAGLTMTNLGPGRNKIFIRGLSDGIFTGRTQSTVGIYLDDTPINFSGPDPDLRLFDVERVELLRGPQGTLYGAGAIGGIYRIVTKKPEIDRTTYALGGSLSGTAHGGVNSDFESVVNLPIVSRRLALRLGGYRQDDSGYIDNVRLGRPDTNRVRTVGGKVALRWLFSDDWIVDIAGNIQSIRQEDSQYGVVGLGARRRDNFLSEPYSDEFRRLVLTFEGYPAWAKVTSATSFIDRDIGQQLDATLAVPLLTGLDPRASPFNTDSSIRTLVHETRLRSTSDTSLEWLLGVFGLIRKEGKTESLVVPGATSSLAPVFNPSDEVFAARQRGRTYQIALFGEVAWNVTDRWTVTAGLRGFYNRFSARTENTGTVGIVTGNIRAQAGRTSFSPKLALSYRTDNDLLVYLQAAQGFRVGGLNLDTPASALLPDPERDKNRDKNFVPKVFAGDTLWNYELGAKGRWLNGHLQLQAAAFLINWRNIQTDQILPTGFTFVTNAGRARNIGFETEVKIFPGDSLEIALNAFWNIPEIRSGNSFLGAERGNRLPGIAEVFGSASLTWHYQVAGLPGMATFDYSYVGKSPILFDEVASPVMGGFHNTNLRLEIDGTSWQAGLFVKNVIGSSRNTFAFGNPFSFRRQEQTTPLRPRTIGIFLRLQG